MIGLDLDRKKCLFKYVVCEDGTSPRMDYKIMEREKAKKELRNYRIIRRIDPNHKFSAPTPKMCNVDLRRQGETVYQQIAKCNLGRKNNFIVPRRKYSALLIDRRDAAISDISMFVLTSLFDVPAHRAQVLLGLRRVFYGLKKMSKAGFCHNGITPENVAIDINNRFYINDFEFLRKFDKYEYDHSNYYAYPAPQVFTKEDLERVYTELEQDNVAYIIMKTKASYLKDETLHYFHNMLSRHITLKELGDNIIHFFDDMKKNARNQKHFVKIVRYVLNRTRDVYSCGITLFYLIETVLSFSENRRYLEHALHDFIMIVKNMVLTYWRLPPTLLLRRYDNFLRKNRIDITQEAQASPEQQSLTVSPTPPEQPSPNTPTPNTPTPPIQPTGESPGADLYIGAIGGPGVTPPGAGVTPPGGAGVTPPGAGVTPPGAGVTPPGAGVTPPGAAPPMDCKNKNKQQCNADETCFYVDGAKRKYCRNKRKTATKKKAKQPKSPAAAAAPTDCKTKNKQQCNADETCFYVDGAKRKYCRNKRKTAKKKESKKSKTKGKTKANANTPAAAAPTDCKTKKNKQECNADETCLYVDGAKRKYCRNKRNTKKKGGV